MWTRDQVLSRGLDQVFSRGGAVQDCMCCPRRCLREAQEEGATKLLIWRCIFEGLPSRHAWRLPSRNGAGIPGARGAPSSVSMEDILNVIGTTYLPLLCVFPVTRSC
jgi:hypothetical protein